MARYRSAEQWSEILAAYSNRTCSKVEFCKGHGISRSSLDYQRRKLRLGTTRPSPQKDTPKIVELSPGLGLFPAPVLRDTELCFKHSSLGEMTVRCHHRDLSAVIDQLSKVL